MATQRSGYKSYKKIWLKNFPSCDIEHRKGLPASSRFRTAPQREGRYDSESVVQPGTVFGLDRTRDRKRVDGSGKPVHAPGNGDGLERRDDAGRLGERPRGP